MKAFAQRVRFVQTRATRLKLLLAAFLVTKALVFVFIVPPWQVPDEPSHVEYAIHLHQPASGLHSAIVASLGEFEAWKYAENAIPSADFLSVVGMYPPLYHWLVSRWLPASSLVGRLYFLRLESVVLQGLLFLGSLWLVRGLLTGRQSALMVASAVLLIPQSCLLFSGVQQDLLASVVVTFVLAILADLLSTLATRTKPLLRSAAVVELFALFGLLIVACLTKRNALIVLPITVIAFLLSSIHLRSWSEGRNYVLVAIGVLTMLFLAIPAVGLYYDLIGPAERSSPIVQKSLNPLTTLSEVSPALLARFSAILFVSFWYAYGWMVYKMGLTWYLVFGGVVMISVCGWVVLCRHRQLVKGSGIILCALASILSIWIVFLEAGPASEAMLTQARFMYTTIAAAVALMAIGWGEFL